MLNPKLKLVNNKIQICCRKNCPTVEIKNDFVFIEDDFGGKIRIKIDEFFLITEAVKELIK